MRLPKADLIGYTQRKGFWEKLDATESNRHLLEISHLKVALIRSIEAQEKENSEDAWSGTGDINAALSNVSPEPDDRERKFEEHIIFGEGIASSESLNRHDSTLIQAPRAIEEVSSFEEKKYPFYQRHERFIWERHADCCPYPNSRYKDGDASRRSFSSRSVASSQSHTDEALLSSSDGVEKGNAIEFSGHVSPDSQELSAQHPSEDQDWSEDDSITTSETSSAHSMSPGPEIEAWDDEYDLRTGFSIQPRQDILYVDPWLTEHSPNPVIFAHLCNLGNRGPQEPHGEPPNSSVHNISIESDIEIGGVPEVELDLKPRKYLALLDTSKITGPIAPTAIEFDNYMATTLTTDTTYVPDQIHDSLLDMITAESSGSPPKTESLDIGACSLACEELVCKQCSITFQTIGLKNKHNNRKHVRRFACTESKCTARFNLKADLQRHKTSVHKDTEASSRSATWSCTNAHCHTPGKIFTRKDNFQRHLVRCEKVQ